MRYRQLPHGTPVEKFSVLGQMPAAEIVAIAGQREQVFLQVHFGAVCDEQGGYGWCRYFGRE